jgi:hypothetical protein
MTNIIDFPPPAPELTLLKQHFVKALDALPPYDQVLAVRGLTSGLLQDEVVLERIMIDLAARAADATIEGMSCSSK